MLLSSTAAQVESITRLPLMQHWAGYVGLFVFITAYVLVALESRTHMRKSKPVILAAGIIWITAAAAYAAAGDLESAPRALREAIAGYGELFLFILAAMTFVNTMEERQLFEALRSWLVRRRLSLRAVFWITGVLSFFLSSQIDNMTTALVMGAVVLTVGQGNQQFQVLACINVVVAANAGGAWCPFGDITTLMVWQAGVLPFFTFFKLFLPGVVNWLVPASIMAFSVPSGLPRPDDGTSVAVREGAWVVVLLFALTIVLAVSTYQQLRLPPALGMMTGLGVLNMFGYWLRRRGHAAAGSDGGAPLSALDAEPGQRNTFDIFRILQRAEWDTLMFFYGVMVAVAGLDFMGHLGWVSENLYSRLGPTVANTAVGLVSAFVDNIPVMFSVIAMHPPMSEAQWLLVTLAAGVGGSLLSIGSAAGVALMGQSRGVYTFGGHLRWSWAIALGYALSIGTHLLINGA